MFAKLGRTRCSKGRVKRIVSATSASLEERPMRVEGIPTVDHVMFVALSHC